MSKGLRILGRARQGRCWVTGTFGRPWVCGRGRETLRTGEGGLFTRIWTLGTLTDEPFPDRTRKGIRLDTKLDRRHTSCRTSVLPKLPPLGNRPWSCQTKILLVSPPDPSFSLVMTLSTEKVTFFSCFRFYLLFLVGIEMTSLNCNNYPYLRRPEEGYIYLLPTMTCVVRYWVTINGLISLL